MDSRLRAGYAILPEATPPEFAVPICRWGRQPPTPPRKRRGVKRINYTPRRLRGGVGAFADDEVGGECSGGVESVRYRRRHPVIPAKAGIHTVFAFSDGQRKIWLFRRPCMDSRFRGNDGGEGAFHPPGGCRPHLPMGTANSDPPPQAARGINQRAGVGIFFNFGGVHFLRGGNYITPLPSPRKRGTTGTVGTTGLEPVTSAMSRQYSDRLSYAPVRAGIIPRAKEKNECRERDSNPHIVSNTGF